MKFVTLDNFILVYSPSAKKKKKKKKKLLDRQTDLNCRKATILRVVPPENKTFPTKRQLRE